MNINKNKINLIFFIFALGLIISFIVVEIIFVSKDNREKALNNAVDLGKKAESEFLSFLSSSNDLLHSINDSQIFNDYLTSQKPIETNKLFTTLVGTQKHIMQLRYIDSNGFEKIRVDRNKEKNILLIPENQLQNKFYRYYFQDSIKKPLQKVWFSALDLNIENKKVVFPYVPTFRAILPLENQGKFAGIIILNYYMEDFLNKFFANSIFDMILLNNKGEILKHYDSNFDWSSYKSENINIFDLYPEYAKDILANDIYRNHQFISVKFDTKITNNLVLVLKLKENYLENQLLSEIYHVTLIGFIVMVMSLFISYLLRRFFKVIMVDLDETKKLNTELNQLSNELHETHRNLNQYIDITNIHVITSSTDLKGKITYVSEAFSKISGYSKEELIGNTHSIVRHPDSDSNTFKEMWNKLIKDKPWHGELKNMKKNGGFYWVEIHIHPIYDSEDKKIGYIAIRHDITNKKLLEEISITDALTNIYNRRYFDEKFVKYINESKRKKELLCFMMIDIDNFKLYNDTYGHQMGDEVIKSLAHVIKSSLKRANDYCFRLGGEEFGILYTVQSENEAELFATKIRQSVESLEIEHIKNTVSKFVTISIGLVCKNAVNIQNGEVLYKEADDYLYKAKENGRNRIVFER